MFTQFLNHVLERTATYIIYIYCFIKNDHLKKVLRQNLIKIYTTTHQIVHYFSRFSWRGAYMSPNNLTMCAVIN